MLVNKTIYQSNAANCSAHSHTKQNFWINCDGSQQFRNVLHVHVYSQAILVDMLSLQLIFITLGLSEKWLLLECT